MFPAIITLRRKYPDVPRPFKVPGGAIGLWLCVILTEAAVIITGFTFLWPGFLDHYIFGKAYSIKDSWGVGRTLLRSGHSGFVPGDHPGGRDLLGWGRAETKGEVETKDVSSRAPSKTSSVRRPRDADPRIDAERGCGPFQDPHPRSFARP